MLCAAAVAVLSGCEPAATPRVTAAAEGFASAVESADAAAACELLSPQVRDTLESASGKSCAPALKAIELPAGQVRDAVVWGDAAKVRTAGDTLFLRELAAGWRITGAGCEPRGERPYDCEVGGP